MSKLIIVMLLCLSTSAAFGQGTVLSGNNDKDLTELQVLHDDLRAAVAHHDRAALDRLYADEFLLIHTTGGRDTKAETITKSLTVDTATAPMSSPRVDSIQLFVYGDVAVRTSRAVIGENRAIWWTWVYVKRSGRWQIALQHGTAIPVRTEVKIDPSIYDAYVGIYEFRPGAQLNIRKVGNTLVAQGTGRPEFVLLAESETQFHVPGGGATYIFFKDASGKGSYVILRRADGTELRANRIP